jgi:ferritin-like metal-binding protein YciE
MMEREILDMLDELIEESHDEQIKQAFRAHQTETRNHVQHLQEVFRLFGWEVDDSPCPTIKAIEKEGKANIKKADDSIVDSIILEGAMETEHHEIAIYENLIIHAQALGRQPCHEDRSGRVQRQAA